MFMVKRRGGNWCLGLGEEIKEGKGPERKSEMRKKEVEGMGIGSGYKGKERRNWRRNGKVGI